VGEIRALRLEQERLQDEVKNIGVPLDNLLFSKKERLGIDVKLDRIFINYVGVNIYGVGDGTAFWDATVRFSSFLIYEFEEKIRLAKRGIPILLKSIAKK